ncbi:MAG: RNA-binding domain-containing protein [Leptospirales bacterium]
MLKTELLEIISNGENSGIEFKRDDIRPEQIAKEVVAFLNLQGGRLLLGIEDDGTISGLHQANTQEWVLNIFRDKIFPQVIPFYEEIKMDEKKSIAVVTVPAGISKPYVVKHNNRDDTYVRMGDRSELASREQQLRLFESGGLLHIELLPVPGTSINELDMDRLQYYLSHVIRDPKVPDSKGEWQKRLLAMGLLSEDGHGNTVCSIAGLLCFGIHPRRFLPQAGIRMMSFTSVDKQYQAQLDEILDAPFVGRWRVDDTGKAELIGDGLIEKMASMLTPWIEQEGSEINNNFRREKQLFYPWEAIRESVINAIAHRDWTRSVDIEITSYSDRLEINSPGKLPNSMTVEKMTAGQRSPRNPIIMDILRDYEYVDARGMGVRTKVIPMMVKQNEVEPIFNATDDYLLTILQKRK